MIITEECIDMGYTLIPIDKIITVEWHKAYQKFGGVGQPSHKHKAKGIIYTTYGKEYTLNDKEEFNIIKKLLIEG